MKLLIAFAVSFLIGVACRYFSIPVPSPPVLPGALLVLTMTVGYTAADRLLVQHERTVISDRLRESPAASSRDVKPDVEHKNTAALEVAGVGKQ